MRIGVASTDRQEEEDWIVDEILERDHEGVFIDPSEVSYLLQENELEILYGGETLDDLDVLLVRRTRFDVEASRDLVAAVEVHGIRTVERKEAFFNPLSKFHSLLKFSGKSVEGVKIPETGLSRKREEAESIAERIGLPLIAKPVVGREGEGVTSIETTEDLDNVLGQVELPVLLQERLEIEEEYRVLVVGEEALGTVVKESDAEARNYARGASFRSVEKEDLEGPAVEIARTLGIEIAGVDIIETAGGEFYEIECNRCPQFKGFSGSHPDIDVAGKIVDYLEVVG